MTMFTEGRLQTYERMMQQTYMNHSRERGFEKKSVKPVKKSVDTKPVVTVGERHGCYQS